VFFQLPVGAPAARLPTACCSEQEMGSLDSGARSEAGRRSLRGPDQHEQAANSPRTATAERPKGKLALGMGSSFTHHAPWMEPPCFAAQAQQKGLRLCCLRRG